MKRVSITPVAIVAIFVGSLTFSTTINAQTNLPINETQVTISDIGYENGEGGEGEGGQTPTVIEQSTNENVFSNIKLHSLDSKINLDFFNNSNGPVIIKIYDVTGREIIRTNSNNSQDVSFEFNKQLPHGIYILELVGGRNKYNHKFYM